MINSLLAISVGASLGAIMRWGFMSQMNHWLPGLPLGTLSANLLGSYLVGVAIALFALQQSLAPEWRLLVVVGFLGSLTTFSGFSAEVIQLIQQEKLLWAVTTIGAHTLGALLMTFLGLLTVQMLQRA